MRRTSEIGENPVQATLPILRWHESTGKSVLRRVRTTDDAAKSTLRTFVSTDDRAERTRANDWKAVFSRELDRKTLKMGTSTGSRNT